MTKIKYIHNFESTFTILGNHDGTHLNPVPYQRLTQKSKYYQRGTRYAEWKQYVVNTFLDSIELPPIRQHFEKTLVQQGKPISMTPKTKATLFTRIRFKGHNHGDPSNIVKGIEDALFLDDKYVDVCTESTSGNTHPEVDVILQVDEIT